MTAFVEVPLRASVTTIKSGRHTLSVVFVGLDGILVMDRSNWSVETLARQQTRLFHQEEAVVLS